MSSTLKWSPKSEGRTLDVGIKLALRKRYSDPVDVKLSHADVSYLEGLVDGEGAAAADAQKLIDAIEKYDEIFVKEEF